MITEEVENIKDARPNKGGPMAFKQSVCEDVVCRDSARNILERKIREGLNKCEQLRVLLNTLPAVLTNEQDKAFYDLFTKL